MNVVKFVVLSVAIFCFLAGCTSTCQKTNVSNKKEDFSCGPRSLSTYGKLTGKNDQHQITDIQFLPGKEDGEPVSMLELKKTALQLGLEAEGYLLDVKNLEGIESYAIIPAGGDKEGSRKNPFHFILVRFSKSKVYLVDEKTLEEKQIEVSKLKKIWKGHALLISTKR